MTKDVFYVGEPIRFRVTLVNRGKKLVYIAKTWSYAGGGYAGFYVYVRQLSGRGPEVGCASAADRGLEKEVRSPEQILREDFVPLGLGEFVGMEAPYHGCAVKYAGMYEITATYSANDFNTKAVVPIVDSGGEVLTGQIDSKPSIFRVRAH